MDITGEEEDSLQSFSEDNFTGGFLDSSSNSNDFDNYSEREPEQCSRQSYYSLSDSFPSDCDKEDSSDDNIYSSRDEFDVNAMRTENEEESIEMLEENNNDPNNNMENENDDSQEFIAMEQSAVSPQPGCSKDPDVIECNYNGLDTNRIAQKIMDQLSMITHESIVKALNKAQIEGNSKQISLYDLLPVSQAKSNNSDLNYSEVKKNNKFNGSTLPSSSSMKEELFNKNIIVDLTTVIDDSVVTDKSDVILNGVTSDDYVQILSPGSRTPIVDDISDSSVESASTSYDNYSGQSQISGIDHDKSIINLPDPESHHRKVYISECSSDIFDKPQILVSLPLKKKLTAERQRNINSNLLPNTYIVNKSNEPMEDNKKKQISTTTHRICDSNNPFDYKHQTLQLVNPVKVIPHSNASATVTSNDYKRKHADSPISKQNCLATLKSCPVNITTVKRQVALIQASGAKLHTKSVVVDGKKHNQWQQQKIQQQAEFHYRTKKKDFIPDINTMSKKTVNISNVTITNQKQLVSSSNSVSHHDDAIQRSETNIYARSMEYSRPAANPLNSQIPSTTRAPQNGPIAQPPKVMDSVLNILFPRKSAPPSIKIEMDWGVAQPALLPKVKDYHDLIQPGPSRHDVDSTAKMSSEIYHKLRAMFPTLNRDYIKKFCPSKLEMDRDVQLSNIVDKIFMDEPSWEHDIGVEQIIHDADVNHTNIKINAPNVEETCEYLAGIFPDADPHYLRDKAINFKDENEVKTFVDQQLQKPVYPTREQYMAKLKITQEQERYTTNFIVADFVKIFPNPFSHFEDPARICKHNIVCLEFLKAMHNRIRVHTISNIYTQSKFNMSIASKRLKLCNEEMKSRRAAREIPTADIPILQEIAFIRHQDEIRKYIDETQLIERNEFQKLKKQGQLLLCQCCYDDECMPSKCSTCENGHNFCNSCIITGTDSKLGDGEAHVPCFMACGSEFSLSTLQNILLPTKFSILLKKRQAAEVMAAGLEGLVSCPFCHFASIPAEADKVFKCLDPECMKESCIKCKEPNHVPLRCDEVSKADKARKYIEEKMTQALARTCYKCKRSFFKDEGCNKITCPCGAIMCYLCDMPIKNYSHFAGQGSNDNNKCPLWTDNERVNAETVRKVAEDARSELLRKDPTLVINTDKLTPELPPPTDGPHNQINGAQNIAVQLAARVMKENRL